jgi:two-component system OmpR family response regulator
MLERHQSEAFKSEMTPFEASPPGRKILIVEDDLSMRVYLESILGAESLVTAGCADGFSALDLIYTQKFNLVILDLGLPDVSGTEVAKRIRHNSLNRSTPIIILSGRSEEVDIVYGLGIGADDYVVKPIRPKEFIARVHLRLSKEPSIIRGKFKERQYFSRQGLIELDRVDQKVSINQSTLGLSNAEYRVFEALLEADGQVRSRDDLVSALTMGVFHLSERNVDVHIKNIRRKLGIKRDLLQTIRGFGYRLLLEDFSTT